MCEYIILTGMRMGSWEVENNLMPFFIEGSNGCRLLIYKTEATTVLNTLIRDNKIQITVIISKHITWRSQSETHPGHERQAWQANVRNAIELFLFIKLEHFSSESVDRDQLLGGRRRFC